jgi:hypothetical protein
LCVSAFHKILWRARAQRATADLSGFEWRAAGVALWLAIAAELGAAGLMLIQTTQMVGAFAAACTWSIYFALIAHAIGAGRREVDCGCSFGSTHRPLDRFQLLRAGILAAFAFVIAARDAASMGGARALWRPVLAGFDTADGVTVVLAALALLALYAALDRVMALGFLRAGEVK